MGRLYYERNVERMIETSVVKFAAKVYDLGFLGEGRCWPCISGYWNCWEIGNTR